jgi:hypothetical protein
VHHDTFALDADRSDGLPRKLLRWPAIASPILRTLDQHLDRRLVATFLASLIAIVQWRNRATADNSAMGCTGNIQSYCGPTRCN